MRLFAAVDPPPAEVAALAAAVDAAGRDERLRYVPVGQWHLTTAFYGEVDERVVPELTERLARAAARTAPMTLRFRGAGTFPKQSARARVLWVGVDGDITELSRLADRCVAAGRRCGLTMEDRTYRPHLTLARAKRDAMDLRDTVSALSTYEGTPWQATTLRLVQSTLGPTTIHETLATLSFRAERAGSRQRP
jgi:2'-5' RNA ligase